MLMLDALQQYLSRHQLYGTAWPLGSSTPQLMLVVPCYDEPDLYASLCCLNAAIVDAICVEVIVVVNDGEHTAAEVVERNEAIYEQLLRWQASDAFLFTLIPLRVKGVRRKHAGVGYARKVGMDLAVWRAWRYGRAELPIVSLDADTLVAKNYFVELNRCFADAETMGAILRFEHALQGSCFDASIYQAVELYELHLRYLNQGLLYSQYPYVCHTVGSAFAVRVSAYAKYGGMNRRQGGEDFYFLHKLLPHISFVALNSTCVYPSSRPSMRVPFGTGPQVRLGAEQGQMFSYHPDVFELLKDFNFQIERLYDEDLRFNELIESFLSTLNYAERIKEIRANAATSQAFVKRFYAFFDAFQLVKFLNFSHLHHFKKIPVEEGARALLRKLNEKQEDTLLATYRNIEGR